MIGDNKERFQELCEQAAKEEDSVELLAIVREINDLIDAKHNRIVATRKQNGYHADESIHLSF
jgi:hypothetical protein